MCELFNCRDEGLQTCFNHYMVYISFDNDIRYPLLWADTFVKNLNRRVEGVASKRIDRQTISCLQLVWNRWMTDGIRFVDKL